MYFGNHFISYCVSFRVNINYYYYQDRCSLVLKHDWIIQGMKIEQTHRPYWKAMGVEGCVSPNGTVPTTQQSASLGRWLCTAQGAGLAIPVGASVSSGLRLWTCRRRKLQLLAFAHTADICTRTQGGPYPSSVPHLGEGEALPFSQVWGIGFLTWPCSRQQYTFPQGFLGSPQVPLLT